MNIKKLSIIIPAFNEEKGIKKTLDELIPIAKKENWEVIVINDGSTDKTKEILDGIEGIRLINHPYNKGYGAALKTGIKASANKYIALYDSDGQHNPQDLYNLWKNISSYDMLVGERGKDSHQEWIRKPGKFILSKVANFLTGKKIPDLNSGLRIIKKEPINKILHLLPDGFSLSTTSTVAFFNLGYNVGYSPIKVNKREGKSSVKQLKHGSNTLLLILRLIVLFNPLKVFIPVSIFSFSIGILYEVLFGFILHTGFKLIPGAFFMMITGILIFFFGLLVDQVSEMRKHNI